jgi:hydrogenase expression/formation protein HypD
MKYIDEFRDGEVAKASPRPSGARPTRNAQLPFHGILRRPHPRHFALRRDDLLPDNVRMIHGPGCPVCVLPIGRVDRPSGWRWNKA